MATIGTVASIITLNCHNVCTDKYKKLTSVFLKGGFGHFIHIFSKCFLKSFIALFYTLMHVVAIFQVSEHFNAPSCSYAPFCASFFTPSRYKIPFEGAVVTPLFMASPENHYIPNFPNLEIL